MTLLFFCATAWLLIELFPARFRTHFIDPKSTRLPVPMEFKVLSALLVIYFFLVIAPLFFLNRIETAWFFAGTYMHFFFAPLLLLGLFYRNPHETYLSSFIKGLRAGVPIAALIAIVQFTITGERPDGFMGNALVFATISMISGFAAMVVLDDDKKLDRAFAVAALISGIVTVLLSNARGMMISFPFLTVLLLLHLRQAHKGKAVSLKKVALFSILIVALIAGMFALSKQMRDVFHFRILEPIQVLMKGEAPEGAIQSRLIMLQSGWKVFTENPVFGYGIANTVSEANKVTEVERGPEFTTSRTHLHNDYLNHLVGGGIISFASFLTILLAPLWVLASLSARRKTPKDPARNYFASVITLGFGLSAMTNLLFGHDLFQSYFLICTIIVAIDAAAKNTDQNKQVP